MSTQIKRIDKALTNLIMNEPFFATLALNLKVKIENSVDTFATDGENLFVNEKFCEGLKDREIETVLAHEVLHCALSHLSRMPKEASAEDWNIACDHEVNWILENFNEKEKNKGNVEPWQFPNKSEICLAPEYKNWASEKIYNDLMSKPKKPQQQQQQQQNKQGQNQGKGKNQSPQQQQQQQNKKGMGEFFPIADKVKQEKLKGDWERKLLQAEKVSKDKGKIPAEIQRIIDELKNPKINWKEVLRNFLFEIASDDYSFLKPNLRFSESDFFLPSMNSEKAGNFIFAIDTSGSISPKLLNEFLSEAQHCLDEINPEKITLISCDAEIDSIKEFTKGDDILKDFKIKGGGGTDFRPIFDHIEKNGENPSVLIYLTDLEGYFPENTPEDFPVLWLSFGSRQDAPFGEVIKVEI